MTGGKEEQSDQESKDEQAHKGEQLEKDGYDDKYLETCQGTIVDERSQQKLDKRIV